MSFMARRDSTLKIRNFYDMGSSKTPYTLRRATALFPAQCIDQMQHVFFQKFIDNTQ